MSNSYTKAAFTIRMEPREAALIELAERAIDCLETCEDAELAAEYDKLGPAFHEAFPPGGETEFASFLEIFDDHDFPYLDCEIILGERGDDGMVDVIFAGEQFGVEQVAELLFRCAKSVLPCGFQYANDCDKLRCDEFGGGCVVITETGITYSSTGSILDRALLRHEDEGADGFVLTIRDREHGLSFWNHATGFSRLAAATVFSETEAQRFDKPIADDEPEWMACPAPLRP